MFTGRFHKPGLPVEVLFDRICRENGITHRLTKIHSPTTTGKIERLHQTLQRELLEVHGPFENIGELQAALDAWRREYNTIRPHQSLAMAFPASRFAPAVSPLELRIPAQLAPGTREPEPPGPAAGLLPAPDWPGTTRPEPVPAPAHDGHRALEVDRVVPPSGNLWISRQQVWLGPALAGRQVTLWVDQASLHVLLGGTRVTPAGGQASDQVNAVGQAGAGEPGTGQKKGTPHSGQIRSESPGIAGTDPGGSPPRTARNDTHRSVGFRSASLPC